jgi:hypothetical protein
MSSTSNYKHFLNFSYGPSALTPKKFNLSSGTYLLKNKTSHQMQSQIPLSQYMRKSKYFLKIKNYSRDAEEGQVQERD